MTRFIIRRLLVTVPVVLGIVLIVFLLARVLPGDPCVATLGERATEVECQEFRARFGLDGFDLRVGIHTGPVLLGGGIDADSNIRGVTVNFAARMEQTAPAGTLRISHETYRHVRGVFDVEPQEPIEIKGITGPVRSYLVTRAKPRAFRMANRGLEGIETQMVGRDAELARKPAASGAASATMARPARTARSASSSSA